MDESYKKNLKILLVDDFESFRRMMRSALESLGYTKIDDAEDGRDALVKLRAAVGEKQPYHIVFADWAMPKATGLEIVETCRSMQNLQKVAVVMVTAERDPANVMKALKKGAVDYIVKPISPEVLEKKIDKVIEKMLSSWAS